MAAILGAAKAIFCMSGMAELLSQWLDNTNITGEVDMTHAFVDGTYSIPVLPNVPAVKPRIATAHTTGESIGTQVFTLHPARLGYGENVVSIIDNLP